MDFVKGWRVIRKLRMINSGLARSKDQRHEIKTSLRSAIVISPALFSRDLNHAFGQGNNLVPLQTNVVKIFVHIDSKQDLMGCLVSQ